MVALLSACTGAVSGGDGGGGTSSACTKPQSGDAPLRRLTTQEYQNTVGDLLLDPTPLTIDFPAEGSVHGFLNQAAAVSSSPLLAERYIAAAEELSERAVASPARLLPCDPVEVGAQACSRQWIAQFGRRVFRRPLADDEATKFVALFDDISEAFGFNDGMRAVIEAMLLAPAFLYRIERAAGSGVSPVDPWATASRLSYLLWGSMPDDALLDAAAGNKLVRPQDIEVQAKRMLQDARAKRNITSFHAQWLGLSRVDVMQKDPKTFTTFSESLRPSLRKSLEMFIDDVFWSATPSFEHLLTSTVVFTDGALAKFLGVGSATTTSFIRTNWNDDRHFGVLTHPALLAAYSKQDQTSPVARGQFIREQLFCTPAPPPPANLQVQAPELDSRLTTRQRFAEHATNPTCANCHRLMDPLGLGLESFDAVGLWRDDEAGLEIDDTGEIVATDVDGVFRGPRELAERLARSETVSSCVVTQWFRFAFGRSPQDDDICTLAFLNKRFHEANQELPALLLAITQSDAFLYRRNHE